MVCCWWCCHPWEGQEYHLPYNYDDKLKRFYTMGHFCSFECAKAYNISINNTNKAGIINTNISLMRKHLTGETKITTSAGDRHALKMFGGTLDIEEFRKNNAKLIIVNYPNEVFKEHIVNIKTPVELSNEKSNPYRDHLLKINNSQNTNEPLKLKRHKPLKRDMNNLEKTIGIIKKSSNS